MQLCKTLASAQRKYVKFDVNNPEHIKAFQMLCIGKNGVIRQHAELRFLLEDEFSDVRSMMFHRVGNAYASRFIATSA